MKTILSMVIALAPLAAGDTVDAVAHLERTRKMFLEATAGLSEAQWKFKPAPDRWSVAECAEHITAAEEFLHGLVAKTAGGPAAAEPSKVADAKVMAVVTDRSFKATSPEPLVPTGRFGGREDVRTEFQARRARTLELVRTTGEAELRKHMAPNPVLGPIDAYQWVLFLSGHTERHLAQIREVKAHAAYPK